MTIVFDLGGVVFSWNPEKVLKELYGRDGGKYKAIVDGFLHHHDWLELDKGVLGTQEAYLRASIRTGLRPYEIESTLLKLIDSLTLNDESVELLQEIHENDIHALFCLSNMPHITIEHLERKYNIWEMFDERLISCRIGMIKPDLQIYKYMIDSYTLSPKDTVFIDDTQKNIDSAKKLGINTILFIDPIQCRRDLEKIGCL